MYMCLLYDSHNPVEYYTKPVDKVIFTVEKALSKSSSLYS